MNREWAIEQLNDGLKVRQKCWDEGKYIMRIDDTIEDSYGNYSTQNILSEYCKHGWELFEEPFNLSDKVDIPITMTIGENNKICCGEWCRVEDIKKFRKQVKDEHRKQCVIDAYNNGEKAVLKTMDKYLGDRFK